jgi:molecular chaperone GrpE
MEEKKQTKKTKAEQFNEEREALQKEIENLKTLADDYKDKWMRNVAEFDNYKKRNAKIWTDAFNEGASSVILKILPVGDNLDWALTLDLDQNTKEGLKGIRKKFDDTLKGMGIVEINPVGEPFDPNVAEAVMQVEPEDGDVSGTVKTTFRKGYKSDNKIIRYAQVSVVR